MIRAQFTNNELEALHKLVERRMGGDLAARLSRFLDDAGSLGGCELRQVQLTAEVVS